MIDPILSVRFPVQGSVLDIDVLVSGIEVDVADRGCVSSLPAFDAYAFEVRGNDKVDVLAGVGEEAEHAEGDEAAHCTWGRGCG